MKSGPGLHRDRGHATRFRQPRGEGTAAAAPFAVAPGFRLHGNRSARLRKKELLAHCQPIIELSIWSMHRR